MSTSRYAALGHWIVRFRWAILIAWAIVIGVASLGSTRISQVLSGGSAGVPGSPSEAVEQVLRHKFRNPYTHLVAVTVSEGGTSSDPARLERAIGALAEDLRRDAVIEQVLAPGDVSPVKLRGEAGAQAVLLVGLKAKDASEAVNLVPRVHAVVQAAEARERVDLPKLSLAVTGMPAITYDMNRYSSDDTSRAEARLIPLTLLVLLVAFGGLIAAGVPLLAGMAATVVTLGICYLVSGRFELSIYVQNVATMIGLAVGIDYSLLMVHRFRRALRHHGAVAPAIAETMETAGRAVTFSGLTVLIGLGGLMLTPLLDTRSIGLGGILVVAVSVVLALTLTPAVLAALGDRINAPRWLSDRLQEGTTRTHWERWVRYVSDRPIRTSLASIAVLLALAAPALRMEIGYPDTQLFPAYMESVQGVETLKQMELSGALIPLQLVVKDPAGPVLAGKNLPALLKLSADLRSEGLVASVASPVDLGLGFSPLQYLMLYRDPEAALARYPLVSQLFVSQDRTMALFQVVPKRSQDLPALRKLAERLGSTSLPGGLTLMVGGTPAYYNDHENAIRHSFPWVVGCVIAATFVVLAVAFRSLLVPLKAVVLNLLSVAAGYGAVVAVFQLGWGKSLIGLGHVHESMPIPILILLMLFGIVFGLSMDYEVFLISAIQEAYHRTGDNARAIVEGVASTARLITSAALIMGAIFGAFAWADFVIVKMLGLGLAVAVLVDATVIRLALLPAFMRLAGRANWYPGFKR
ncbi:MMPL family transporter [bacterium]|nr:MMPL family transporter [bacterium]